MTPYNSIKNHGAARFQAKGLGAGQSLHRRDWAGVLLTQKLLDTNLATPESFIPIDPTVQKLIDIFQNTESHKQPNPQVSQGGASNQKTKKYAPLKI